jgi:hypothetical protein
VEYKLAIDMKLSTMLGISAIFAFGFGDSGLTLTLSKQQELPTVGIVNLKNKEAGAGCYFSLANAKVKSNDTLILYSGDTTWMNLNGRDIQLKMIKDRTSGATSIRVYTATNLQIRVESKSVTKNPNATLNSKAMITISHNNRSKKIEAIGYCGC